jgi:hypothetical protein
MTENNNKGPKKVTKRKVGRTNKETGSSVDAKVETPLSFDNATIYHYSVKLYYNDDVVVDHKTIGSGKTQKTIEVKKKKWLEILPFPQEVSGEILNKFVAMVYAEADANSYQGMKACVDATIRRIGNDSWGKLLVEPGVSKTPMNLQEAMQKRWFDSIDKPKYKSSLDLNLKGGAVKSHNLAYKAVCTVIKETNGATYLTYPYNQWFAAEKDPEPGGVPIGGNNFRINNAHPHRPE